MLSGHQLVVPVMSSPQSALDRLPPHAVPGGRTASARSANLLTLFRELKLRDLALDRIWQGLCVFNEQQRLVLFNRRYAEMYDIQPSQLRLGMTLRDVVDLRYAAGTGPCMPPEEYALWRDRVSVADRVVDTEVTLRDGRIHAIHHEPTMGGGWVATFDDVTDRRQAEAQVRRMAMFDELTGLPNRASFNARLEQTLPRLRGESRLDDHRPPLPEGNWLAAVLILDLDNFKDVNDTLGHVAGDALLQQVAQRIAGCLRPGDMLARLGGDEFAVLLEEGMETPQQVAEVARRVINAASVPYELDGHETVIGLTGGVTLCSREDGITDPARLVSQADIALDQAKSKGRGTCCFFQPEMHAALHRRKDMERDLRRALAEGGLEVYFQPITAIGSRHIVGAEALARWFNPVHGVVPPSEFIPLAESAGLIGELGAWVLRTACAQAAQWDGLCLAVNLSPEQVRRPGIVEQVATILRDTGLPPSRLELEITEGCLLHETPQTLATLSRLRALGVSIALDDFGTGFSSLSYLRRYPFTKLKVDRSFVASMAGDAATAAIVQAVVTLGRSLSMRVIAEGVETEAQFIMLGTMDCDEAQGYLLGRPCRGDEFDRLIARQRGERHDAANDPTSGV